MAKEMNLEALQANLRMMDKRGELAFEEAKAAGTLTPEQEKFSALIADEAFLEKFFAADSAQEVQALFKENGMELSEEAVNAFGEYIACISKLLIENGGEISQEDLEQVAGGSVLGNILSGGAAFGSAGVGAGIGTLICPGIGSCIGVFVGAVGGIVLSCEGNQRGWYESAAGFINSVAGYTAAGAVITFNNAVKGAKKLGGWIKSWF